MTYEALVKAFITVIEVVLGAGAVACLIRSIIGPKVADRLVAVNMIGTQVMCLICLVAARSGETGFVDIAIIFAMLSFLGVVVLTKILSGKEEQDK